ncbi:glycoside hydrolase family 28 protein [Arenibacter sp. F26102]|uniref:glycoside hydrolase family 28 protein n=1 Tax=Arenibacter sp. F26102 TaxID=2926416 RepID=UPI001FF1367D|nr:glycoside hydrolase family 28 protein [Arenibacter sp. F26102]MCK0147217.1 glycoside hydrolase family 28 protein [Arenibacter sp. F26102]
MKIKFSFLILLLTSFFISCTEEDHSLKITEINIKAPFEMPTIKIPDFSNCKEFLITSFGAVQGDQDKTTKAIADAIFQANKIGGGIVVIPKGVWSTGKIHFKSNVNLHLNDEAVLLFSDNPEDYLPAVSSTWEGLECYNYSPLIYAFQCKNIAITGKGILKAKMDVWTEWFKRPKAHMDGLVRLYHMGAKGVPVKGRQMVGDNANFRPHFIQFNRCENILVEGISIQDSPFWVIHPFLSKDIVIRDVKVKAHGHNNDGVDPEMSQNILIENCTFDQGDDAIAVKSGRNQDSWRLNTPSKNIVIRNCIVKNGHELLAIGSELSGGIENIFVDNCIVTEEAMSSMDHLVFIKTNERRGGFVKNIFVSNIKADHIKGGILGIETDVLYQWRDLVPTYERKLTSIESIFIENIQVSDAQFISKILGQKELPVQTVILKNVRVDSIHNKKIIHENIEGFNWVE